MYNFMDCSLIEAFIGRLRAWFIEYEASTTRMQFGDIQ